MLSTVAIVIVKSLWWIIPAIVCVTLLAIVEKKEAEYDL